MNGADLPEGILKQLEDVLDSDPVIDEVGFIHPSQFRELAKEAGDNSKDGNMGCKESDARPSDLNFWTQDHKLGILTAILLPLYRAAKHAFMEALKECTILRDSCKEFNYSEDDNVSICSSSSLRIIETEAMKHSRALLLLSCDFGTAWNLRRWVIKMIAGKCSNLEEIVQKESEFVEKIAEKSKMNYRAWNHRCWLVSYMSKEQLAEVGLQKFL